MKLSAATVLSALVAGAVSTPQWKRDNATCKCYPGDECWPTDARWKALNQAVQGRLSSFVPAGAVCYPSYNNVSTLSAAKCDAVKANWTNPNWIVDQPFEGFSGFWSNNSCNADNKCNSSCTAGLNPAMVVMAKNQFDMQVSVNFARINNLRLVIRNTGHDYLGRSMGFGSLGLNTHNLANIQFVKAWTGPGNWTGGAVKLGAGVMFRDLYAAAHAQNVDVVGGECPTVGAAGGYILGGGHSPLSGLYGLASDNVLEFNVILASGSQVAANAESNPDLFWALKGGGMSSLGAVYGVTLKTRPTVQATGATFNISMSEPNFWKGVAAFHSYANTFVDAGFYVWYVIKPKTGLSVQPFVAPNMTVDDFNKVMKPFLDKLASLNVTYKMDTPKTFPTFYDLHQSLFAFTDDVGGNSILGGRLISKDDVAKNDDAIVAAIKAIVDAGHPWGGHLVNPGRAVPDPTGALSAVHPVWRNNADVGLWLYSPDECGADRQKAFNEVTHTFGDALRKASPASAVYANEGDVNEPNWQDAFWGSNYKKLLEVKAKYDPDGVFWAKSTPGSEKWALQADERRLCKVQ